jgi:NADPH-dependent methylglyoxal reductase
MSSTILLTGATGFIALHITDALLKAGFKVIGTVRSQSKADKISAQFKELYPNGDLTYAIVEDIAAPGAFDDVLKNNESITGVLHTASPFSFGLDKPLEDAYLTPAVEGTKNILISTKKFAPQVDRVIVTSSFASIYDYTQAAKRDFVHTDKTWNPIEWEIVSDEGQAYYASKKLAEREVWKFVEEEKPNFKVATVTPPYVFGTQFFDDVLSNPTLNTSAEIVNKLLSTPVDANDFQSKQVGLAVDVRDVAYLHVKALQDDKLLGNRLFPSSGPFLEQSILNIMHKNFPELDGKIGKGANDEAVTAKFLADYAPLADTTNTLELVGRESWIPIEDTVVAATKQILDYRKANGIEFKL